MKFAKVMFLHLPVILFTGRGVCLNACWDTHTPGTDTPPPHTHTAQCMLGATGNKRAVGILLECIFVQCNVFSRVSLIPFVDGETEVHVTSTYDAIGQCGDPPPELFKLVHLGSPRLVKYGDPFLSHGGPPHICSPYIHWQADDWPEGRSCSN